MKCGWTFGVCQLLSCQPGRPGWGSDKLDYLSWEVGRGDIKWDSQWHSVTSFSSAAEGTCLPKFRSLWSSGIARDRQGKGGTPSVWVSGGAGESWLHFCLCLGSAAKCCTVLCLSWLQVSVGSELQVCSSALALVSQGLQRCHKAAWCVTAWNISHLEHCCHFPLYWFFHARSCPWLKIRQTFNCKNKNGFSSHFSKCCAPLQPVYSSL